MPTDALPPESPDAATRIDPMVRARMAARARTLSEVIEDARRAGLLRAGTDDAQAATALRAWNQAFAPGDAEAFARRLAWEGLDTTTAAWVLSGDADATCPPTAGAWLTWIEQAEARAEDVAADVAGGVVPETDWLAPAPDLPFPELLLPMVRTARDAIERRVPEIARLIAPAARRALERQLARELAGAAALAMHARFQQFLAQIGLDADAGQGEGATEPYRIFILTMLAGGGPSLWAEYPVLARQVATISARHVENVVDLVRRFDADAALIAERFGGGAPGAIVAIEPALSDPHEGRRRVMALTLASGLRVVYKPRDVRLDAAFSDLLAWLADRGLDSCPYPLAVLPREGYGWIEFAAHAPQAGPGDVARYYRQAGALLCLTHLLRGRDLHMENVVATRHGPVIVDLEMLFEPQVSRPAPVPGSATTAQTGEVALADSCLDTGLLSFVETGPDGALVEMGGLRGRGHGSATLPRRVWTHLGTSAIAPADEPTFVVETRNAVLLDGVRQEPEQFAAELLEGFTSAWRAIADARQALLAAGGPLESFRGCEGRVLTRGTNQYGMLIQVLAAPKYQQHGARRSAAIDVLARGITASTQPPPAWSIFVAERRCLERLDVPRFIVRTDEGDLRADGEAILKEHFARPGLEAAADRIRRMAPEGLQAHLAALERALQQHAGTRYLTPLPDDTAAAGESARERLARHAEWIADELIARATLVGGAITWPVATASQGEGPLRGFYLHDGALAASLCLAAVGASRPQARWREAALASLAPLAMALDGPGACDTGPLGATSGLGSLVYGLTLIARLLEHEAASEMARRVARSITPDRIGADTALDVVAGSAGAALALLALHEVTSDADTLARAAACGDRLLATEARDGEGGLWPTAGGAWYLGFAHGVAGIATALARLAERTGEPRYRAAAARAYRRLASTFVPARGNWPIVAGSHADAGRQAQMMWAWCHGAPGIVLALLAAPAFLRKPGWAPIVEAAVAGVASAAPHRAEHVCCGNLSRAECLLEASRRMYSAAAGDAALRVALQMVTRARQRGHVRLSAVPYAYKVYDPGFLQGLSGVGYELIRMTDPTRVPSVLSFEVGWAGS